MVPLLLAGLAGVARCLQGTGWARLARRSVDVLVLAARRQGCATLALLCALWVVDAQAQTVAVLRIDRALAVQGAADRFPADASTSTVTLPDDWSRGPPGQSDGVWYRIRFDLPTGTAPRDLLALYIERACSSVEVDLNGQRIHRSADPVDPRARHCDRPELITLPAAWLKPQGNLLDLRVQGSALPRVATRQRAGGLSALLIGPQADLAATYSARLYWNVTAVQLVGVALLVVSGLLGALGWQNRSEPYLGWFGALSVGSALMSARLWWSGAPLTAALEDAMGDVLGDALVEVLVEVLVCTGWAVLLALGVMFLLRYARRALRGVPLALCLQCLALPGSLWLAGPDWLFEGARAWSVLLAGEALLAAALYLWLTWRARRPDFWPMLAILCVGGAAVGLDLVHQLGVALGPITGPPTWMRLVGPLCLLLAGLRLLHNFASALQAAEAGRSSLEVRVQEITTEIERNFAQLAELRVEQVTEKERKRIAGDLHDDLGAKLLTIVHTSDSERISTLAREALEEMRLSVRGLTGRPMRLADALADWRAETVMRLGQANIETDWRGPADETEQLLPARGFVQTTRILREAVSNIIKHSEASQCTVRCAVTEQQFSLSVQDNGKGIPMELDGKLDRGHGMSSMKHRARQMQGQCLVESGIGCGTVIRLTLPL